MPFIPFGEYKPDLAPIDPSSTSLANNVIPGSNGDYLPFASLSRYSAPLGDRCRGMIGVRGLDRSSLAYAGTANNIFLAFGQSWIDKTPQSLTLSADEQWSFCQYKDLVIAASWENPVLSSVMNSPQFSDMITGTRRPRARQVAVVNREWVVLGNCNDAVDGERPGRVWWLARGNPASADPNLTTLCDFEDLDSEDGAVQGVIGAEYGTIFCEHAVWRMTYEGPPSIFRFDKVVRNKGAISPGSIANFGRTSFFWAEDGPYIFDGSAATPIGQGKIAQTAIKELNYLDRAWISSVVLPQQTVVMWALPTTSDVPDKLYVYNWSTSRWSTAGVTLHRLFRAFSASAFIDDIAYSGLTVDGAPQVDWPVDGEQFVGGQPTFGAFAGNNEAHYFNGPPMEATIETAEYSPFVDRRALITAVRPIVNGSNDIYVQAYIRDNLGVDPTGLPEVGLNNAGFANAYAQARYIRLRTRLPAGFKHALGVHTEFRREGVI